MGGPEMYRKMGGPEMYRKSFTLIELLVNATLF